MRSAICVQSPSVDAGVDDLTYSEPMLRPTAHTGDRRRSARILIASAYPIVRHGMRALLTDEVDIDVVAEADNVDTAVMLTRRLHPDVVLLDLLLSEGDGILATRSIRSVSPAIRIIIMAGAQDDGQAVEAIRAGACAYLSKAARTDMIIRTIRDVDAGLFAMPSHLTAHVVRGVGRHDMLSERESQVLRLVAHGKSNKLIARELDLAESTVKTHVGSVLGKLGLESRTQMALFAARTGLVGLERPDMAG